MFSRSFNKFIKTTWWYRNWRSASEGPYCQKYTPTDCFIGDFVHWE